jgi:beta-fructofuranosidase
VDVRDPFVLTVDGRRLGVQGAGVDGRGAVLVYDVADLDDWRPLGTLLTADEAASQTGGDQRGHVWECPQLVRVGDAWVLLVSWLERDSERFGVTAFTGRLDVSGEAPRFVVERAAPLDAGPDLYAPQAYVADDGRVLVWGWSWEGRGDAHAERPEHEVAAAGWAGVLTCPRELALTPAGTAVTRPVAELAGLRGGALPLADGVLDTDEPSFRVAAAGAVVVSLVDGAHEVRVWASDGPAEVLVDGSLLEAFEPARSTTLRAYPRGGQRWRVRTSGDAEAHVLRVPAEEPSTPV